MFTRSLALGVALSLSLVSSAALAAQVVVLDQTWTHAPDLSDSHFRVPPSAETPVDLTAYAQGTAYVYLEVHSKPTAQPTKFQVCFEANPTYACTAQSPTYTDVGVYEWDTPFANFWSPPGESVDWSKGINKVACILKDTMNGKPSADNVGEEMAALYMPTDVRMVVTLVEPGGMYTPPTPTGEDSTGGDTSSGGLEATTGSSSTGEPITTGDAPTTGAPDTTGGPPGTTTADPLTTSGDPESGDFELPGTGTTTSPATGGAGESTGDAPAADSGGCSCTGAPGRGGGWLALFGLALGLLRRRRA